jgi:uncharacterized MAPEG superfamily protein
MHNPLSPELYWLTATIIMTALFWVPYILDRIAEYGIKQALWDPVGLSNTKSAWAIRMIRAHENAIENLALFAPLVLALHVTGQESSVTALACMVYFFARAGHFLVFTLGIPVLRIVFFLAGVACQMVLAVTLLGIL